MKVIKVELENPFQADVLSSMLQAEGIPHDIVNHHSEAYNGLFQMAMGWGYIEIPIEYTDKATACLENYQKFIKENTDE